MATAESKETDFKKTPQGWAQRFQVEFTAAREALKEAHDDGAKVVKRFLDKRGPEEKALKRINLFHSNSKLIGSMVYGRTPRIDVARKFADADDDVARVASDILERLLNCDIERDSDSYEEVLDLAFWDRRLPGLGVARLRYEREEEEQTTPAILDEQTGAELAPAVTKTVVVHEDACVDYVYWKDFLYGPCRVWPECPWISYGNDMTIEAFDARFPKHAGKVPFINPDSGDEKDKKPGPWSRVRVHEIWHKESRKRFFYVEGYSEILEEEDDPLGLEGFFPSPKPLIANPTTDAFLPRADYMLSRDIYVRLDIIETRIANLVKSAKVRGLYNKASPEIQRLLDEASESDLIPVEKWESLVESNGIRGQVDWMPLEMIVATIAQLREEKQSLISDLWQVEGLSDIMRGQAAPGSDATATERSIQARFGSVRIQALQDEFARFAADIQRLKAEIIAKFFAPETIIERSNARFLSKVDKQLVPEAIKLIKDRYADYRVEVKPENLALQDAAADKQEASELMAALYQFCQGGPLISQTFGPAGQVPYIELGKQVFARFKGAAKFEGIFDQMAAAVEQQMKQQAQAQGQPPPPDPKVIAAQMKLQGEQMKMQGDQQKIQAELQADITREQAKLQADKEREANQRQANVAEHIEKTLATNALKPLAPKPTGGDGRFP